MPHKSAKIKVNPRQPSSNAESESKTTADVHPGRSVVEAPGINPDTYPGMNRTGIEMVVTIRIVVSEIERWRIGEIKARIREAGVAGISITTILIVTTISMPVR